MAVDYTELAAIATELIEDNGRSVELRKKSRTVTDPAKPWRGTSTTPIATVTATAVVFDVTDEQIALEATREDDRELILRGDKMAVIPASALAGSAATNLVGYDTFVDGVDVYQIVNVETVKPGPTTLIYILTLKV